MKTWVGFSLLLTCVIVLSAIDAAVTIYAIEAGLGFELNPIYEHSPEAFFFAKGVSLSLVVMIAYELKSRNPILAKKGLLLCTAILAAVVAWNFANITVSLGAMR